MRGGGHCKLPMPQARDMKRASVETRGGQTSLVVIVAKAKDDLQNAENPGAKRLLLLARSCRVHR